MDLRLDPKLYEHAMRVVFGTDALRTNEHDGATASSFDRGMREGDWRLVKKALLDGVEVVRDLGKARVSEDRQLKFNTALDVAIMGIDEASDAGGMFACAQLLAAMRLVL